jgi:poly-beta-1,6-N-acetyl-D-glucosamine N-deacetylase
LRFKRAVRNIAGSILAIILISLGHVKRAKRQALQKGVILAIAFHNPDSRLFKKVVSWFRRNGFVFISSALLIDILNKRAACPRGAVWISLDDGWQGNVINVIPSVEKHDIPITIFVCTDAIEDGTFWWRKVQLSPRLIPAAFRKVESVKKLPESERKQIISEIDRAGTTFSREAMNIEELIKVSSMTQVTIGAHTASHPILPKCSDSQIKYELEESKRKLEEWTGKKVTTFAYPNGSLDGREKHLLETCGYSLAATTESKLATTDTEVYLFPRNLLMDDGSFSENLCHALGVWEPVVKKLKQLTG